MHRNFHRIHSSSVAFLIVVTALFCSSAQAQTIVRFDLPAQPLEESLRAIGAATKTDIGFALSQVAGLTAPPLKANLTVDGALARVLAGTRLRSRHLDDHTIVIATIESAKSDPSETHLQPGASPSATTEADEQIGPPQASTASDSTDRATQSSSQKERLEEVVVTGTHIHYADPITPVMTLTHDDIVEQGYTTIAQVIEQLPQNFKAGASQDSNPVNGIGNGASNNYGYASGVNLRGLGANATLILLNGRRLAPTAYGGVTDISQIPVSIIDHIDILTDGASAIYGSDAVGGVVNVITKHDFSGVEVGGRINSISEGKAPNYGGNVLGGTSWESGNIVLDIDHEEDNPLFARDRTFTAGLPNPTMLAPRNQTSSFYASLQEQFTDHLTLSGDALVTHRLYNSTDRLFSTDLLPYNAYGTVDQSSGSLEFDYKVSSEWTATLVAQASKEADSATTTYPDPGGSINRYYPLNYDIFTIEPRIDGKLFDAPGGASRLAVGGQFRRETFNDSFASGTLTGPLTTQTVTENSRHISSLYGELLLPIVGDVNAIPLVQRLRADISGRYDDYSDFGHTFNPKIGVDWAPVSGLALHATYSRSFQAPTVYETSNDARLDYGYTSIVPDPKSATGSTTALLLDGTNPNLQPETANNIKVGLAYESGFISGLKLDMSYFRIDFKNQINRLSLEGFGTNALQDEAILGSYVERDPSLAQIAQALSAPGRTIYNSAAGFCVVGISGCPAVDAASIGAIANLGYQNSASVRVGGFDLIARYVGRPTAFGRFRADLDGTYFTTYQQRITATAAAASPLNTVYNPLRFRAKANAGWELAGWGINARLNYSNSYENTNAVNPNCPSTNGCQISSWTTIDFGVSYATPGYPHSWFENVRIGLDVTNLFNRAPPFVSSVPGSGMYPYDPTNANPFLRTIGVTVTKRIGGAVNNQ